MQDRSGAMAEAMPIMTKAEGVDHILALKTF